MKRKTAKMTRALRVGRISYLNTEPFMLEWPSKRWPLVSAAPRQLAGLMRRGLLDAGPVPVVDAWTLEDTVEPLGNLGIACDGEAVSVALFSREPVQELKGRPLCLTEESSTSVRLLKMLMAQRWQVTPRYTTQVEGSAARLLIGDAALKRRRPGGREYPYVYDLGEEWKSWTGLPFVFARWVVRKSMPREQKEALQAQLERSLCLLPGALKELSRRGAERLKISPEEVEKYLATLRFRLGAAEGRAEETFRALLSKPGCSC